MVRLTPFAPADRSNRAISLRMPRLSKGTLVALAVAASVGSISVAGPSAQAALVSVWDNSNIAATPTATLDWFTGGPDTQANWTGSGVPSTSDNTQTIQFFNDVTTALTNTTTAVQVSNINNSGVAVPLSALTLDGKASATGNLTETISGDPLNFSAATGTINLNAVKNGNYLLTYNVNSNLQLGTASSASVLTITGTGNGTFNIGGNISELQAGGGSVVKSGTSTVKLSGTNTYSGVTTVNGGTLSAALANGGTASGIGESSNAASNLIINAATLTYSGVAGGSTDRLFTINGTAVISSTGNVTFTNTGPIAFLTANTTNTLKLSPVGTMIFDPLIQDNTGNGTVKTSLSITGNNGNALQLLNMNNSYTGVTNDSVNGNTLTVNKLSDGGVNSSIGAASAAASNLLFGSNNNSPLTLRYIGTGDSTNRAMTINTNSHYTTANTFIIDNEGTGALVMSGSPVASLSGTNFFDASPAGIVLTGTTAANLVNQFNGTIADFTTPAALNISKSGAATWSLGNAANTYTGATILNAGILQIAKLSNGGVASAIGASTNATANLILNGGTLQYTGSGDSTDRNFRLTTSSTLDSSGTGAITFGNTTLLSPDPDSAGETYSAKSGNATISGLSSVLGLSVGMVVTGPGIPANTTIVSINTEGTTDPAYANTTATGNITLSNKANATVSGNATFGFASRTLTLTGTNTGDNLISGILADSVTGALGVTKTGAGTWNLGGNSTYTGATAVNGGTLLVNGSLTSATTVNATGTLGGCGTISALVTIAAGGTLSPGNSPGELTVSALALTSSAGGSTTTMQIGGATPGSQYDNVDVTTSGGLTYGGLLNIVSYIPYVIAAQSGSYDLFSFTGGATGDFNAVTVDAFALTDVAGVWTGTSGGATYTFTDATGILNVATSSPVPEPASLALLAVGTIGLLRRRRSR